MIITATMMFSIQFAFTKKYQLLAGDGLCASFVYNAVSPLAFGVIMLFICHFCLDWSPFTIIMSMLWAVIANAITYYSIRSLRLGSVSNYSIFLLGGGMVLPAIFGFIIGDAITIGKCLGIALIIAALVVRSERGDKSQKGALFSFLMIFLLNGAISIVSVVYQSDILPYTRGDVSQFSAMRAFATSIVGVVCLIPLLIGKTQTNRPDGRALVSASPWALIGGTINGVANLFLLISLRTLDASLQFPILTGGNIFFSALVGLLFKEKPTVKGWVSVGLAVAGSIAVVL